MSVTYCFNPLIMPTLYNSSLRFHFHSDFSGQFPGFKLLFSFHSLENPPQQLHNGLFVCSTPLYNTFQHHLSCNFVPECENGEDERDCPRSTEACRGALQYGHKCYRYVRMERAFSWDRAAAECRRGNSTLAGFKTTAELKAFREMVRMGKRTALILVGLQSTSDHSLSLYAKVWRWMDGTMSYGARPTWQERSKQLHYRECAVFLPDNLLELKFTDCDLTFQESVDFICEFETRGSVRNASKGIVLSVFHRTRAYCKSESLFSLIQLPDKHFTQDFLSCDDSSGDESENPKPVCSPTFPSFACDNARHIPFSLVCDFHADCADSSDEGFCYHRDCTDNVRCINGQCLKTSQMCDGRQDCRDASDELFCRNGVVRDPILFNPPPPVLISFNAEGDFHRQSLGSLQQCPETHFLCPDSYCLPVYVVCNGVYDCPGWEDETQCDSYTCPGFYRCRHSAVCLHPQHLCDGVFQCPLQDDELLCNVSCPQGCRCQGLSTVCPQSFPASLHPQLRYVDVSGTGMSLRDLSLIHI